MWTQFLQSNSLNNRICEREINLGDLYEAIMPTDYEAKITELEKKFEELTKQLNQAPKIEEHQDVNVTVTEPKDVSLDVFKTLPEFNGDRVKYATWRSMSTTAMELLDDHRTSMRYFEALMIIRNKVTGPASNILNNYNTAFNFGAIIDRLDFTYADKRPFYVLEQELLVLQQGKTSIDEFYDKVNEKLNHIINKVNMTHKEKSVAKAFVESANEKALRTFITGLNHKKGELLYASHPTSLPEAYARLQTIMNDQERINFANRYNHQEKEAPHMRNPQFKYKESQPRNWYNQKDQHDVKLNDKVEPMEVDKSSTNVNIDGKTNPSNRRFNATFMKREYPKNFASQPSTEQNKKQQRVFNIEEEKIYAKTIVEDVPTENFSDEEFNESSSAASIFLGE